VTTGSPKRMWLLLAGLLLIAPCAWPQLQVGDETSLKLNGVASLGWTGTYDGSDMNSLSYGFSGNFTGDYHDPRFLNWNISPYLNQSRLNSNYYSTTSASGVNATANFLSSSRTPVQVSYAFDHNAEGTFNVPGSIGAYETVGSGQTIGVNAAYLPEDWPSIQASFSHSGSSYEIIGNPGGGTAHSTAFGMSSSYELWGTNLFGSYTRAYINNENPQIVEPGSVFKTDSNQDSFQFGANRRLTSWSSGSFNFSRSHLNANYQDARTDSTYDTFSGLLSTQATSRLSFNFHANYSSNLSAQYLSNILAGGNGAAPVTSETPGLSFTSSYLTYGVTSGYNIARSLTAIGSINRQVQGQPGLPDATSTIMDIGLTWSHQVLGGTFSTHYGIAYYFAPLYRVVNNQSSTQDSTFTGQNASASYSRRFLGFTGSGSFSYSRSLTSLLVGYLQNNYAANGSVSRNIASWSLAVSSSYSQSHIDGINISDSSSNGYSASLAHGNLGLGANYSRSHGSGLQVGTSIVPNPVPGPLPQYLVLFGGESYGGGVNYRPIKRWTTSANYTKLKYNTQNLAANSNNTSEQFYIRTEYSWRQLFFNGGYSHLKQGFGTGPVMPATINTVYFGVSRRFDIF
jgi:hypothetical protein